MFVAISRVERRNMSEEPAVTNQPQSRRAQVLAYVRDLDPNQVLGKLRVCRSANTNQIYHLRVHPITICSWC